MLPIDETPAWKSLWFCQTTPEKRPFFARTAIRVSGLHCLIDQPCFLSTVVAVASFDSLCP